jgi:hypothetical protein
LAFNIKKSAGIMAVNAFLQSLIGGVTAGTITASKGVTVDANKDCGDFRNLDCTNLDAGASGTAGTVDIFPSTASRGKIIIQCADNTTAHNLTITNAALNGASKTFTIPALTGYAAVSTAALTLAEVDVLDDAVAGTVVASKAVVVDASSRINVWNVSGLTTMGTQTSTALYLGAGNSTTALSTSTADKNFVGLFTKSTATSGDSRGIYAKHYVEGAGGGGEALRAYTMVTAAAAQAHGAHITGQLDTGGQVTGQLCGARVTAATKTGLTLAGGSICALRIDTDLNSAVSGMTESALIDIRELQTNKMGYFLTTTDVTGCLKGSAPGAINNALKCRINGTDLYIPLCPVS